MMDVHGQVSTTNITTNNHHMANTSKISHPCIFQRSSSDFTKTVHHKHEQEQDGVIKPVNAEIKTTNNSADNPKNTMEVRHKRRGVPRRLSMDRRINESERFLTAIGENHHRDADGDITPTEIRIDDNDDDDTVEDDGSDVEGNDDELVERVDGDVAADHADQQQLNDQHAQGIACHTDRVGALTVKIQDSTGTNLFRSKNGRKPVDNVMYREPPFQILSRSPDDVRKCPISVGLDYRGIGDTGVLRMNRGILRGNYARLHRKAWLEVSDSRHRYGKNLRLYYRHWEKLGHPTNRFFDWLDLSKPLPDLPDCPRSILDSDTVMYLYDDNVTKKYELFIQPWGGEGDSTFRGQILDADGSPVQTGPDGWIFVLRDDRLYGSQKVTTICENVKQRFHHSSFFGGKAVASAGIIITDDDGFLTRLLPHSGHYRPGEQDVQRILCYLYSSGVDLSTLSIDMQQLVHVCRHKHSLQFQEHDRQRKAAEAQHEDDKPITESRSHEHEAHVKISSGGDCCHSTTASGVVAKHKKSNTLYLQNALDAANFLSHKAKFINDGIFEEIVARQAINSE